MFRALTCSCALLALLTVLLPAARGMAPDPFEKDVKKVAATTLKNANGAFASLEKSLKASAKDFKKQLKEGEPPAFVAQQSVSAFLDAIFSAQSVLDAYVSELEDEVTHRIQTQQLTGTPESMGAGTCGPMDDFAKKLQKRADRFEKTALNSFKQLERSLQKSGQPASRVAYLKPVVSSAPAPNTLFDVSDQPLGLELTSVHNTDANGTGFGGKLVVEGRADPAIGMPQVRVVVDGQETIFSDGLPDVEFTLDLLGNFRAELCSVSTGNAKVTLVQEGVESNRLNLFVKLAEFPE